VAGSGRNDGSDAVLSNASGLKRKYEPLEWHFGVAKSKAYFRLHGLVRKSNYEKVKETNRKKEV